MTRLTEILPDADRIDLRQAFITLGPSWGHANISITLDRYGHMMPGSEDEAGGLLDAYLDAKREAVEERVRAAAPPSG